MMDGRSRARILGHGGCAMVVIVSPMAPECVSVWSPLAKEVRPQRRLFFTLIKVVCGCDNGALLGILG